MTPDEAQARLQEIEALRVRGESRKALDFAWSLIVAAAFDLARESIFDAADDDSTAPWQLSVLAWAYFLKGECHHTLGQEVVAVEAIGVAQRLFEQLGEAFGVANCSRALGELAEHRGDLAEAEGHYETALRGYEGLSDTLGVANCLYASGGVARRRGDGAEAERLVREALAHYEELSNPLGIANCLYGLGELARHRSDGPEAGRLFWDALAHYERLPNPLGVANCLHSLGDLALQGGDGVEAEWLFKAAKARHEALGDTLGVANCLHSLGVLALRRGYRAEAEQLFRDGHTLFQELLHPLGAANCLRNLGQLAQLRGDVAGAERFLREALTRYEALPDARGVANCHHFLGEVAWVRGNYREVGRLYREALAGYEALPDPLGIANCLRGLGRLAHVRGNGAEAERLTREALTRYEMLPEPQGVAHCLRDLAELAYGRGNGAEAERLYRDALARYEALPDPQGVAHCLHNLGDLARASGNTDEAEDHYRQAEEGYRQVENPLEAWLLQQRARLRTDDPQKALSLALQAVAVVEQLRLSIDAAYARYELHLRWQRVYLDAIRYAVACNEGDAGLRVACLLMGRLLYEQQFGDAVDPRSVLDEAERTEFEQVTMAIAQAERELEALRVRLQALRSSPESDTPVPGLEPAYVEKRTRWEGLLSRKSALHDEAERRVPVEPPAPPDLEALRAVIAERGAALAVLLWQEELHLALVLQPDGTITVVRYSDDAVAAVEEARAQAARYIAERTPPDDLEWRADVVRPLSAHLWGPLAAVVGDTPVFIVPDPALSSVPWRALSRTAHLLPTPGALLRGPVPAVTAGSIFAVGGDVPGGLRGPALDLELVRVVGGTVPAGDPLAALFAERAPYETCLVTGHMSRAGVMLPRLDPLSGGYHSVSASLRELAALRLTLRNVVLAGCLSAATDGSPDLLSAGAVVMQATGAEAVCATLWPVDDRTSTLVWAGLLHHLRSGLTLEAALDAAVDELRESQQDPSAVHALVHSRYPAHPDLLRWAADHRPIYDSNLDAWVILHR